MFDSNSFSPDAFSPDAWDLQSPTVLPPGPGNRRGLRHFSARHFSGLRHFFAIHFIGIRITAQVVTGGSGGGPYTFLQRGPGYYTLDPRYLSKSTRYITVKVEFKEGAKWRKDYVIDIDKLDVVIKIFNWVNRLKDRINVGVEHIRKAGNKVSAMFKRSDK